MLELHNFYLCDINKMFKKQPMRFFYIQDIFIRITFCFKYIYNYAYSALNLNCFYIYFANTEILTNLLWKDIGMVKYGVSSEVAVNQITTQKEV